MLDQSQLRHAAQLDALRKFARRKQFSEDVLAEKRAKRALRQMKR